MAYESWRITFQSAEHAARAGYAAVERIDAINNQLRAGIKDLQQLADAQAAIIAAKNDEIESLRAELSACKAGNDYAGDLAKDAECGGRGVDGMALAAGQGG